jgi:fibrillarin-like pre-rRNA processing protein
MKVNPHKKFEGIFLINGKLATVNLVPGSKTANEKLVSMGGKEYRLWDPYTSKPAAAIKSGLKEFTIKKGMKILYLGLASAKTATFFSDIIGSEGIIYGVEISERVLREAIRPSEMRGNIIPILADARRTELYENIVIEKVDCVYEDVADPDQVEIFIRNCKRFLKKGGFGMIAVKSRSIDVLKEPKEIYKETKKTLEKDFKILDFIELDPFEKDHGYFVCQLR